MIPGRVLRERVPFVLEWESRRRRTRTLFFLLELNRTAQSKEDSAWA
jgi:hypothetical protein